MGKMKKINNTGTPLLILALLMAPLALKPWALYAQDLQAELDALDDLPEDDLGFGAFEEDIPDASSFSGNTASAPRSAQPMDPPARQLGVGDLDLQGLEEELNFDSFRDGGKLSVDQLNQGTDPVFESGMMGKVTSLNFRQLADRVRLVISADRPIDWTRELRSQRRQVILEMRNMMLSKDILKRALDTGEFEGPVAYIQAFPAKIGDRDSVKVLFQLRSFVDPTVLRTGNDLVVDFPIVGGDTLFRSRQASQVVVPKTYLSSNDIKEFVGAPINLNVKEADLGDILKFLSEKAGKNFVLSRGIQGNLKITVGLNGVPWDQALAIILFNQGLGYQDLENVYRVATVEELRAEIATARQAAQDSEALIPLETRLLPLSYAAGADVQGNVNAFLSERGSLSVDARTNTLVATDIPEVLEKIERYVRSIDKQTPQVLIEGRIVEASEGFSRSQSINWQLTTTPFNATFGSLTDTGDDSGDGGGGGDATGSDGGTFQVGGAGFFSNVLALLRFSEDNNLLKTIASPRVTVLNNETATISQGQIISRPISDEAGNTVFQDTEATTALNVTPQVTSDGFVTLQIDLKRDIPQGTESVATRSAQTKMIVESGKTAVIGGLYTLDTEERERGMPWLKEIPIFGVLFKNQVSRTRSTNELLMFISPRIVNRGLSQVLGGDDLSESNFSAGVVEEAPQAR